MITIFSTPRAFIGHFGIIQRNAIASWTYLNPRPQILIMGDEPGTAEACKDLGVTHVPDVTTNEFGTPLMDSMVDIAESMADFDLLLLVTIDTLLFDDTFAAAKIVKQDFKRFCIITGRRHIYQTDLIDFSTPDWGCEIKNRMTPTLEIDAKAGDYFLFTKGLWGDFPPFAIGRTVCDNWMYYYVLSSKGALVDGTEFICSIHQDHDYSHHPDGVTGIWTGLEAQRNKSLINIPVQLFGRKNSNWLLNHKGILKRRPISFETIETWLVIQRVIRPGWFRVSSLLLLVFQKIKILFTLI